MYIDTIIIILSVLILMYTIDDAIELLFPSIDIDNISKLLYMFKILILVYCLYLFFSCIMIDDNNNHIYDYNTIQNEQSIVVPEKSGTIALFEQNERITLSSRSMVVEPWWTERELDLLAALIYYEAGSNDCSDRHQQLVGQVVLNRVANNEFPDTIYDVITQKKPTIQYSTYKNVISASPDEIPERCYDNALVVLRGEVDCPDNIVWQANFKQGSGVYEIHKTSYSTTYFCHR